jgi:hypothetical protein
MRRERAARIRSILLLSVSPCLFLLPSGCGYRTVYATDAARLHVRLARTLVADAVASDEVASGAREELARAGMLEAGEGWPCVEVEVLRADETSEGVAAGAGGPVARATGVALVARAWIETEKDAAPQSDTGDVRAEETIAVDEDLATRAPDPRASVFHHADALRAAARRLGRQLARRLMGLPAASDDGHL